jgi:hypothetical protein
VRHLGATWAVDASHPPGFLDDPVRTEEFIRGQHAGSSGPAYLLAKTHDVARFTRLLDLGGGSGAFAIEMVRRHGLSAIVVDHPAVVAVARKIVGDAGDVQRGLRRGHGAPHVRDITFAFAGRRG